MPPDPDDKPEPGKPPLSKPPVSKPEPGKPVPPARTDPVLPVRSEDETGIGWGEVPEPDDDERLRRDRPPHWDQ